MIFRAEAHVDEFRPQMRGGEGTIKLTALANELPGNMRLFSLITIPKGGSIGYHMHENETELFYFLKGSAMVSDDDEALQVSAGDVLSTPSGHSHSVENVGEDDLVMLACIIMD